MKLQISQNKITLAFTSEYPYTEDEIQERLIDLGYEIPESNHTVLKISNDGRESLAKRFIKENIEVFYDPKRGFLSSEGLDIIQTNEGFKDIIKVGENLSGSNFDSDIKWAELNIESRIIGDKRPLDSFDLSLKTDMYEDITDLLGMQVYPYGLSLYSSDKDDLNKPLNEIINWSHITIQPLVRNPKYYYCRIVYRQKDLDNVSEISNNIKGIIENLIRYLESD